MNCILLQGMGQLKYRFESKIAPRHTPGWKPTVSYKEEHELSALNSEAGDYKDHTAISDVEITK